MRPLIQALIGQFYQMVAMETVTVTKIVVSISGVCLRFYDCARFHYHQIAGKSCHKSKSSNI